MNMEATIRVPYLRQIQMRSLIFAVALIFASAYAIFALPQVATSGDGETMTIEDAPDMQVIAISKTVVVKKQAKEVLVWGGDVIIEGRVEGDVAAIGGSVIQKQNGFIGGDVIVFGGQYKS